MYRKPLFLIVIIPFTFLTVRAQDDPYSLLTEPYNERPLTLHQGQLQINGGYQLGISAGYIDPDGEKVDLRDNGTAVAGHRFLFDIRLGILEFLEFGASMNYETRGVRGQTLNIISGSNLKVVTNLNEYSGFNDLDLSLTARLPIDYKNYGFALTGLLSLPTAKHEPDEPSHYIEEVLPDGSWTNVHYVFNENNGVGVLSAGAGARAKLAFGDFALFLEGLYRHPLQEGESIYWTSFLDNEFSYEENPYAYLPRDFLYLSGMVNYQAVGWLNIFAGAQYQSETGGWFERGGVRYAYPGESILGLLTGLEIQVATHVRLFEYVHFPVSGQNVYSRFYIHTGLSYNLFTW